MHARIEQLLRNLLKIDNLGYCTDSETAEMRIEQLWLRIGIADDSDTRIA